jgi:hypothetical protein
VRNSANSLMGRVATVAGEPIHYRTIKCGIGIRAITAVGCLVTSPPQSSAQPDDGVGRPSPLSTFVSRAGFFEIDHRNLRSPAAKVKRNLMSPEGFRPPLQ